MTVRDEHWYLNTVAGRVALRWYSARLFLRHSLPHRVAWAIAWRLPRRVVNLAAVRVWSAATTGEWSGEDATRVTLDEALRRWEKGAGR